MKGMHVKGVGKASARCNVHKAVFNTQMFGTFNIRVSNLIITNHRASITLPTKKYWFVSLKKKDEIIYGWAIRDNDSKQRVNTLEILTKELIPKSFIETDTALDVTILKKWNKTQTKEWAKDKYWFQTFPFSPVKRADSALVWDTIKPHADWFGKKVLDVGCHYGYFSFEASKQGALVHGVDVDTKTLNMARTIRDNIIQQDVKFSKHKEFKEKSFDTVLYLSVHHQVDPNYIRLKETIEKYKKIARECVFVELIMPPMFPKNKSIMKGEIDRIIGGEILLTYKHKVRGERTIYKVTV